LARRIAAAGVLALGLAFFVASPRAEAHALLRSSDPAAGAQLDRARARIVLSFTETPDPSLSVVHVLNGAGSAVERGHATVVAGDRNSLVLAVPSLERGSYTVTWRTTSSVDGHTTAGAFAFGVQVPPNAAPTVNAPRTRPPSPLSVGGRWALYLGLAAVLGASRFTPSRRGLGLAWLVAISGGAALAVDLARASHAALSDLATSTTGTKLGVELAAVVLVGLAIAFVPRAAGWTAAGALLARAWAGHAAASTVPWFTIGVQWLHLVAIGLWIGGLPWLAIALRRAAPHDRGGIVQRFSRLATLALLITVVTGSLRALSEVGSWRGLFHTSFGVTLLVKLGVVALVIGLGTFNRRHGAPARSLRFEVIAAAAVLGVTAVLAGFPPSASVRATAVTGRVVATGNDFGTTVRVRLEITPGNAGPNRFTARITDYDTGDVVAARAVTVRLMPADRIDVPPSTMTLARSGSRWVVDSPVVAIAGPWQATVGVDGPDGAVDVPLRFSTRQPPQQVTEQRTPGLPTIYTITIGGRKVQTYVDPGRAGNNEVHFTFFDSSGNETPTDITAVSARRTGGTSQSLEFRRLGPGHFVADASLTRGTWRFTARTTDGSAPAFSQSIR